MSEQQKRITGIQNQRQTSNVNLAELMFRLLENWVFLLSMALVFGIGAGAYTLFFVTPLYKATSTIYVLSRRDSAINFSDLQIGTALTSDYIKVFSMWEVHEEVISNLDLEYSYKDMQKMLSVANDSGTRMIDISITSPDPNEAAKIANEYAKVVSQYIANTMSTDKPNIMSVALVPANPISPVLARNAALSAIIGIMVAFWIVFIRFINDDKYKTAEDILRYTGLTTLALIPYEENLRREFSAKNGHSRKSR